MDEPHDDFEPPLTKDAMAHEAHDQLPSISSAARYKDMKSSQDWEGFSPHDPAVAAGAGA
jgi:hypothetical protein